MAARNTYEEKIRVGVETSGDREVAALRSELGKLSQGSDAAAEQAQALVAELDKLAKTSSNIKQFTTLKASITETATALEKAKERLAAVGAEADRTEKPTAKLQASLKRAATEVENLSKQQNRQQAALQRTSGALRAAGIDTDQLADAYDELQGEFGQFAGRAGQAANAMRQTGKDSKAAATGVTALDRAATVSKKSLGEIAARLTMVSGAATVAIKGLAALSGAALFSGGIRSAATLEEALSQVRAVSGATADEMERLSAAAEEGGARTRFSTLEAAQGLGELARATGSAQQAIAALPATLSLAQAAGLGVAEAAQFITTTLTQYGLAADQASRVSDVLAQAANTTTADVQGLGNALSYAAPLANQLGLDVERTTAIIGEMADQGFRGERAGTALRNVFSEMLNPASEFAKALRELGIESTDFVDVIDQLASKGKRGQEALLKLDAAARPAILALVNSGGSALRQLDTDLRNAAGSAETTAKVMGDNLSGAAEQIRDTFDRTRRSLVEPLLEPLKDELFALAGQLEEFAQSPEFEEIKQALAGMFSEGAAAARDLIQNVDFAELATKIRTSLADAGTTITEFKENLGTIVATVATIGNAFALVFNSVQAAVLLVAATLAKLASVGAQFGDAFTRPAQRFLEFIGVIEEGAVNFTEIAGGLNAVANEFGDRFANNFDEAAAAAQRLAGAGTEAGVATTAGLGAAAEASTAAAAAAAALEPAAAQAAAAMEEQGRAATESATSTAAAANGMVISAERLKQAFSDMGITAQVDLERAAESAKANFGLIREAVREGQATAEDARRAFGKYADAARAAVADSDVNARTRVESELRVAEAVLGVGAALDDMGRRGLEAGEQVGQGARTGSSALREMATAASDTGVAAARTARGVEQVGTGTDRAARSVGGMSVELTGLNDRLVQAYLGMNRYATNAPMWVANINQISAAWRQQNAALDSLNADYDEQLAKLDPLHDRLEELKAAYPFVEEAKLRATAEKAQRLEDEAQRRRDEAKRLRDQAREARDEAAQASGGEAGGTGNAPVRGATPVNGAQLRNLGSLTIALPDGTGGELVTDDAGADLVARMLEQLERSRAITTRRRR